VLNRLENQGHSSPPSLHWQRHTFANNLVEAASPLRKWSRSSSTRAWIWPRWTSPLAWDLQEVVGQLNGGYVLRRKGM